jgi:hypothetical protein
VFIFLIALYVSRDAAYLPRLAIERMKSIFIEPRAICLPPLILGDGVVTCHKSSGVFYLFIFFFFILQSAKRKVVFSCFLSSANDKMKDGGGRPDRVSLCVEWERAQRPMFSTITLIDLFFFRCGGKSSLPLSLSLSLFPSGLPSAREIYWSTTA